MALTVTAPKGPPFLDLADSSYTGTIPFTMTPYGRYYCVAHTRVAAGSAPDITSVTQGSLVWTQVASVLFGGDLNRLVVFEGVGTPTLTVAAVVADGTYDSLMGFFAQTLSNFGLSDAVSDTASVATITLDLGTFEKAADGALVWVGSTDGSVGGIDPSADLVEAFEMVGGASWGAVSLLYATSEPADVSATVPAGYESVIVGFRVSAFDSTKYNLALGASTTPVTATGTP